MSSIITNSIRLTNAEAMASIITEKPTYVFMGKSTSWPDEELPPTLVDSDQDRSTALSNILAYKKIEKKDICSVTPRRDWVIGTVYDYFDHRVNMVDGRKETGSKYNFYVLTDEFNVYKCLSNNNNAPSTSKPNAQQITPFQTSDGYIWKYMYTIRANDVFSFLTKDWMPIYTIAANDGSNQWNVQQSAIPGGIHEAVVNAQGIGYSALVPPQVTITGDGTGASAIAVVDAVTTRLQRILITNPGVGYTYATVSFSNSGGGVGASASAIIAPSKGHGADAKLELGGYHKMVKVNFVGEEGGKFPISTFRQTGVIHKPLSVNQGSILYVTDVDGVKKGSILNGQTSGARGTVLLVEVESRTIWLKDVVGDFSQNEPFIVNGTTRTILTAKNDTNIVLDSTVASSADALKMSGDLLYISNRTFIQRVNTQTEEVRVLLTF